MIKNDNILCVLEGYLHCAAKVPEACICAKMPRLIYEEAYKRKYGSAKEAAQ